MRKKIGFVATTANNSYEKCDIIRDKSYGVTCSGFFTSNGSIKFVSTCLAAMIVDQEYIQQDVPDYTVQVWINGSRYYDEQSIFDALLQEYIKE